jgi:hypothetical protein
MVVLPYTIVQASPCGVAVAQPREAHAHQALHLPMIHQSNRLLLHYNRKVTLGWLSRSPVRQMATRPFRRVSWITLIAA